MVSFELGKEIEKDVFLFVTSVGKRKTSESPRGIEPQTFGFRAHRNLCGWSFSFAKYARYELRDYDL